MAGASAAATVAATVVAIVAATGVLVVVAVVVGFAEVMAPVKERPMAFSAAAAVTAVFASECRRSGYKRESKDGGGQYSI
jgi:hypothetical protein